MHPLAHPIMRIAFLVGVVLFALGYRWAGIALAIPMSVWLSLCVLEWLVMAGIWCYEFRYRRRWLRKIDDQAPSRKKRPASDEAQRLTSELPMRWSQGDET